MLTVVVPAVPRWVWRMTARVGVVKPASTSGGATRGGGGSTLLDDDCGHNNTTHAGKSTGRQKRPSGTVKGVHRGNKPGVDVQARVQTYSLSAGPTRSH